MAIDAQSLGYETPPIEFDYTWRDTVVYALGVGASASEELDYLYEGRGPKVLPTFCTVPTFAAFDALVDRIGCDRQGMVHHSQQTDVFEPLRPEARLRVMGKVAALYDLKRFAMSVFSIDAYDENDELVTRGEVTLLLRNDGGFGGERPPKTDRVKLPERDPDFETHDQVGPSQALLYRLSGDYNPLHADPDFAAQAGFDRPILHGLCTYGYAGRAVVAGACGGDPDRLGTLSGAVQQPCFSRRHADHPRLERGRTRDPGGRDEGTARQAVPEQRLCRVALRTRRLFSSCPSNDPHTGFFGDVSLVPITLRVALVVPGSSGDGLHEHRAGRDRGSAAAGSCCNHRARVGHSNLDGNR